MSWKHELAWKLFGMESVLLFDFDGEVNARFVHNLGQYKTAKRLGFGIRTVILLPGGALQNGGWVRRWEPLWPPQKAEVAPLSHPPLIHDIKAGES